MSGAIPTIIQTDTYAFVISVIVFGKVEKESGEKYCLHHDIELQQEVDEKMGF